MPPTLSTERFVNMKQYDRVKFVVEYDCYPFIESVPEGATGTVVEVNDTYIWVVMDEPFGGYDAETWAEHGWPQRGVQIDNVFLSTYFQK